MNEDYNNTVICHVNDCKYHDRKDVCTASKILIDCDSEAKDSENTLCQTFEYHGVEW